MLNFMDSNITKAKTFDRNLTAEERKLFESWLAAAEPFPDDAEELITYDEIFTSEISARRRATLAKRILEGKL